MCGIAGYVGKGSAKDMVLQGLERLEYRGYDSAGMALLDGDLEVTRRTGKVSELAGALEGPSGAGVGIGHTRWATHGEPSETNAHPHQDCSGEVAVVHNGIIENHTQLRDALQRRGHTFTSETDSEVVAHLVEERLREGNTLTESVRRSAQLLEGSYAIGVVHRGDPQRLVGARKGSPLLVGVGREGQHLASDATAFVAHTKEVVEVGDGQVVKLDGRRLSLRTLAGTPVPVRTTTLDWDAEAAERGGHSHFMLKEILEQPQALAETLQGRVEEGRVDLDDELQRIDLESVDRVVMVGCGSAYNAALVSEVVVEHASGLPVEVEIASEMRYKAPVLGKRTLVVAVSQSGETLDTLMAAEYAKTTGAQVVAVTNTVGSALARCADAVVLTRGGVEVGVAATKTFLTQVAATTLVGLQLAQAQGVSVEANVEDLEASVAAVESMVGRYEEVKELARTLAGSELFLFLGRHVGYPVALEGALKLKELTYLPAQGFAAGELKHGPIALVDEDTVVVAFVQGGTMGEKMRSNVEEVRARGAQVIAVGPADEGLGRCRAMVATRSSEGLPFAFETSVFAQILSAEVALARGLDVDRPRNLAKSVTVE